MNGRGKTSGQISSEHHVITDCHRNRRKRGKRRMRRMRRTRMRRRMRSTLPVLKMGTIQESKSDETHGVDEEYC